MEDTSVGELTVRGQIKWFDAHKGYGFIAGQDGAGDVLLHQTCVRQSGFQQAVEGASWFARRSGGRAGCRPASCCRWTIPRPR